MGDQVAGHLQGASDLLPAVPAGVGFDRGDDDLRALIELDSPGRLETLQGRTKHRFGQPGPDSRHSRPGRRHHRHAELDTQQPADIVDQFSQGSLVARFEFTVALAECSRE